VALAKSSRRRNGNGDLGGNGEGKEVPNAVATAVKRSRGVAPAASRSNGHGVKAEHTTPGTGKAIARLRGKLGLSVLEFARRLGVSAQSVHRWESVAGPVTLRSRPRAALAQLQEGTNA
jgi:DNA-binding transcriptional regulator YiaG